MFRTLGSKYTTNCSLTIIYFCTARISVTNLYHSLSAVVSPVCLCFVLPQYFRRRLYKKSRTFGRMVHGYHYYYTSQSFNTRRWTKSLGARRNYSRASSRVATIITASFSQNRLSARLIATHWVAKTHSKRGNNLVGRKIYTSSNRESLIIFKFIFKLPNFSKLIIFQFFSLLVHTFELIQCQSITSSIIKFISPSFPSNLSVRIKTRYCGRRRKLASGERIVFYCSSATLFQYRNRSDNHLTSDHKV